MQENLNGKKTFVLDTNVILHDSTCLGHFEEHDLVIPIAVIEELDSFKRGNGTINENAREFARSLDALAGDKVFKDGVPIGPGKGQIRVALDQVFHKNLKANFSKDKPDHRILNVAYHAAISRGFARVVLVTKDVNLRLKAKSIKLQAEDYRRDRVRPPAQIYKGIRVIEGVLAETIDKLYEKPPSDLDASALDQPEPFLPNEYLVLKNGSRSALAVCDPSARQIRRLDRSALACYGIRPRNTEQAFVIDALLNRNIPLVTVIGKSGTGKTLLALAAALEMRREYRQILVSRPTVPLSNQDLGFLPGDLNSKLDPYMQPIYDNFAVIEDACAKEGHGKKDKSTKELLEEEKIVINSLSHIRGRSIVRSYFIIDEAQNLTPHEAKTIVTRAGEGTKVVFTGDIYQIDHPYLDSRSNGLSHLVERMKGQKLSAHVNLEKGERSVLAELAITLL